MDFMLKTQPVQEIELAYIDQGSGPVLVFIHGLGENATAWDAQIHYFSRSFRTIAPDLRGHGNSGDGDIPLNMSVFAADIMALLNALEITSAHFIGLSMGGLICQELTLEHITRMQSMTLADSTSFYPDELKGTALQQRLAQMDSMSMEVLGLFVAQAACKHNPDPHVLEKATRMFQGNRHKPYLQATQATFNADYRPWYAQHMTEIPTLILVGEEDCVTPLPYSVYLLQQIKNARLRIICQAGHLSRMENPAAFNAALLEFLGTMEPLACNNLATDRTHETQPPGQPTS